jgi:beta-glucosidase
MKTTIKPLLILCVFFGFGCKTSAQLPVYKNPEMPVEERVQDLLSRMTPEEKFWQLFMIPGNLDQDKEKFHNGIFGLQVSATGSTDASHQILDYRSELDALGMARTINAIQKHFVEETRLGIPIIPFEEALHGLVGAQATAFPQAIALAATFDTDLISRVANAIAHETKSRGIRQVLSPVVNIANDVRWGRVEETYGEDPFLASEMGVAFVSAFENMGVITTPKHFVANVGDGGRDSYPIHFNERFLEEIHFPPFVACIERGGSRSIMTAYNSLDGSPATASNWLLNQWLKEKNNFQGFVISDANAVGGANVLHFTASDYPDASAKAMNNGLDVIFQTDFDHYKLFIPPFLDGRIEQKTIDEAVARVLRMKFELGLFENPYVDEEEVYRWNNIQSNKDLARQAAIKSSVLLKNEKQILPFSNDIKTIAVIGSDAIEGRLGGYSGPGNGVVTIFEGLRERAPGETKILFAEGCGRESHEWVAIPGDYFSTELEGRKVDGLLAAYYNNINLSGEPVVTRIDPALDFRWTLLPPHPDINFDFFSVRFTGKLKAPETGIFKIGLEGNDGYRLYLDGKLIVDNWRKQTYRSTLADFNFIEGREYDLKVEFFESSGSVWLKMVWDVGTDKNWQEKVSEAANLARQADLAIVVAGIEEGEGFDRASLRLPGHQEEMIRQIAATQIPVVVLLVGGSAITMSEWMDQVDGIMHLWYPGEEGGHAVAALLFGDYSPSGRLPITFPVAEGQLPLVYNHKPTGRNDDYGNLSGKPLFPFGFGLSYTSFQYSNLVIEKPIFPIGESSEIRFKIKNSGKYDGEEVVQLYLHDRLSSLARPVKELKGFKRVILKAGEEKEIRFTLTPEMMKTLNEELEWVIEPGEFRVMIGASSMDIRLREIIRVN